MYRLRTDTKFSLPLGKATSPAAVPVRPLRPETAASTSLIISRTMLAVVTDVVLFVFSVFPGLPFCSEVLEFLEFTSKQEQATSGGWDFKNAGSRIPYIGKTCQIFSLFSLESHISCISIIFSFKSHISIERVGSHLTEELDIVGERDTKSTKNKVQIRKEDIMLVKPRKKNTTSNRRIENWDNNSELLPEAD